MSNPLNPDNFIPALAPPPGQTSNFVNSQTLWKWNLLCVTFCLTFTTIPFFLRCYTRIFIKREWMFEDYMICLSWAGLVAYCGMMTATMAKHGGVHQWDLTQPEVREVLYWFNITSIEYSPLILITKLTILTFYRRIFVPIRWSTLDTILRIFETILVLFYFALTIVKTWECVPRERIWDKRVAGTCISTPQLLNTSGLFNFITDLLILLVPVKAVWSLNMKNKRKLWIVVLFTVGSIAPVFSMIGFIVRIKISANPDATYHQPEVLLWATAEVSTGLICVSVPPLSALFHRRQKGPTQSILNGERSGCSSKKQSASKRRNPLSLSRDDPDISLATGEYLELKENFSKAPGIDPFAKAIVTGVKGGGQAYVMEGNGKWVQDGESAGGGDGGEAIGQEIQGSNIVKTVEIDQSFV